MPSRLRTRENIPVDRIELDGGDYVMVRRWFTAEDRDEINDRLTKVDGEDATFESVAANRVTALQAIVSWGGPGLCTEDHEEGAEISKGHTCKSVPVTFQNVSALHDEDLRKIINHVSRRSPRPVAPKVNGPFPKGTPAGVS